MSSELPIASKASVTVLAAERRRARDWLFDAALPIWWKTGADRVNGGFHDKIGQDGAPVDLPKRARVQARQVFVYAEAGRLGWDGPWREAVAHGLDFLLARYRRKDGLFRGSVDRAGRPVADMPDLYDQAFVLFALAAAYAATGRPAALHDEAVALLRRLERTLGHPIAGFEEAHPRQLPLRSNPHMHMLEALLAWVRTGAGAAFEPRAREIVDLARERLIDPATGAIGEYYDGDWRFAAGDGGGIREPGHQFEWSYLLDLAGRTLGGDHAAASERLARFGEAYGVADGRVVFSLDAGGRIVDGSSRLWAQTERLRTMLLRAGGGGQAELAAAAESFATLERFLDVPIRGLWRDRIEAGGTMIDEPAPASSFYHIVTGLLPLIED